MSLAPAVLALAVPCGYHQPVPGSRDVVRQVAAAIEASDSIRLRSLAADSSEWEWLAHVLALPHIYLQFDSTRLRLDHTGTVGQLTTFFLWSQAATPRCKIGLHVNVDGTPPGRVSAIIPNPDYIVQTVDECEAGQ